MDAKTILAIALVVFIAGGAIWLNIRHKMCIRDRPKTPPKTLIFQGFRRFLFPKKNRTHNKQRLAGSIFANRK